MKTRRKPMRWERNCVSFHLKIFMGFSSRESYTSRAQKWTIVPLFSRQNTCQVWCISPRAVPVLCPSLGGSEIQWLATCTHRVEDESGEWMLQDGR